MHPKIDSLISASVIGNPRYIDGLFEQYPDLDVNERGSGKQNSDEAHLARKMPAIAYAAIYGKLEALQHLHHKKGASLAYDPNYPKEHLLTWINECEDADARKKLLEWLLQTEKDSDQPNYTKIGANITETHIHAALGILPTFPTKPTPELTQLLSQTDAANNSVAYYAISSGYMMTANETHLLSLFVLPNPEEVIAEILKVRPIAVFAMYTKGLLKYIDFDKIVNGEPFSFTLAKYMPDELIQIATIRQHFTEEITLDLNLKNSAGQSIAYVLLNQNVDTDGIMQLAKRMIDNGSYVDLNNAPSSSSNHILANYPLYALLLDDNEECPKVKLYRPLTEAMYRHQQILNYNMIPTGEMNYKGMPMGVALASTQPNLFVSMIDFQSDLPAPNISREEKIRSGWIIDFNQKVTYSNSPIYEINLAMLLVNMGEFKIFSDTLMLKQYEAEKIDLNAMTLNGDLMINGATIAWYLAYHQQFELLEKLVDRLHDDNAIGSYAPVQLSAMPLSNDRAPLGHNVAAVLAEHEQFELLKRLAHLSSSPVQLNPYKESPCPGLGYFLIKHKQKDLFKLFLSRLPVSFVYDLTHRITGKIASLHVGANLAWVMAQYEPSLLRELFERHQSSYGVIDLNISPQKQKQTLRAILAAKDPQLLKLIEEHNAKLNSVEANPKKSVEHKKEKAISNIIKPLLTQVVAENTIPKTKVEEISDKLTVIFASGQIKTECKEITKGKIQITFTGNDDGLNSINKLLKDQANHYKIARELKKSELLATASENIISSFLNNGPVRKSLDSIETKIKPKVDTDTRKDSMCQEKAEEKTPMPTETTTTPEPIILDQKQRDHWIEQLKFAFCHAKQININWINDDTIAIALPPGKNAVWQVYGNKTPHNNIGYLLSDDFINKVFVKKLHDQIQGASTIVYQQNARKLYITVKDTRQVNLQALQDINFNIITRECEQVTVYKESKQEIPFPTLQLPTQNSNTIFAPTSETQTVVSPDLLRQRVIEFLTGIQRNVIRANRGIKEIGDSTSFAFLQLSPTKSKTTCTFTFSSAHIIGIGKIKAYDYMCIVRDDLNRKSNDFMRVKEENNMIVINFARDRDLDSIFNADAAALISDHLINVHLAVNDTQLERLHSKPIEIRPGNEITASSTSRTKSDFKLALSKITDKDIPAIQYHLLELTKIQNNPPSSTIKVNDEYYYHLYLFHTLMLMRLFANKINDKKNVFYLMRHIMRHTYEEREWFEFYGAIQPMIECLKNNLKFINTKEHTTLYLPESGNRSFAGFEALLAQYKLLLDDEQLGRQPNRQRLEVAALQLLVTSLDETNFSDFQKRDMTIMSHAIIGERLEKDSNYKVEHRQHYLDASYLVGHVNVRAYPDEADAIYAQATAKKRNTYSQKA